MTDLLSIGDAKTIKGQRVGWRTAVVAMLPHRLATQRKGYRGVTVCPHSTPACRAHCLRHSGHGSRTAVLEAAHRRTMAFLRNRTEFLASLSEEIHRFELSCARRGFRAAVRLNAFSDLRYESIDRGRIFRDHPGVQFYDYTKDVARLRRELPENYHLTPSWTERDTIGSIRSKLSLGGLAVPFTGKLPEQWFGLDVVDGDTHDLRFLDAQPWTIIGMSFKGKGGSRPLWTPGTFAVKGDES